MSIVIQIGQGVTALWGSKMALSYYFGQWLYTTACTTVQAVKFHSSSFCCFRCAKSPLKQIKGKN